ncbi:hypothetical protein M9H77_33942 [Catharanthus roseus]|uniref:Uncharacterized protein n=1 Tax=Catharanthus roseus TaxID=4058 RepID=A0ACB9ZLY2_CATRO|nr:hypothetical protein M9H77_33942 [Catharanthus roseus]
MVKKMMIGGYNPQKRASTGKESPHRTPEPRENNSGRAEGSGGETKSLEDFKKTERIERRLRGGEQETTQESKQQQLKEKPGGRSAGHQRTARVANPNRPGIPKTQSKETAKKPIPHGLRPKISWGYGGEIIGLKKKQKILGRMGFLKPTIVIAMLP